MKLSSAFGVRQGDVVAFTGAGGKTSTLVALGHELADAGWRVLALTTTRIGRDQLGLFPRAIPASSTPQGISAQLSQHRMLFLHGGLRGDKAIAPPPDVMGHLLDRVDSDVLLIEADGARGLPLKAPRAHEPVVPPETTLLVPVASLAALGRPLDEQHVMNASAVSAHFGFPEGAPVKSPWIAQILRDPDFGLKGRPPGARAVCWINAVPASGYLLGRARLIAQLALREPTVQAAAFGSARASEPVIEVQRRVSAIVLAAGESKRMGEMKVLLPWAGDAPILSHILGALRTARLEDVVVVTGRQEEQVRAVAEQEGARCAHNADYAGGEMLSSLQRGLRALSENVSAALVVLGDQPQIQPSVVHRLLEAYARGEALIVAPSYDMRRGHPIVIDRRLWPELLALPSGAAPRDVINRHAGRTQYVNVDDDSILRDVDTPEAYRAERRRAGFG